MQVLPPPPPTNQMATWRASLLLGLTFATGHAYQQRAGVAMRSAPGPSAASAGPGSSCPVPRNRFRGLASSVRRLAVSTGASPDEVLISAPGTKYGADRRKAEVEPPKAKRDRLVCRIDDRWVDLTGWRNAHPAGSHWIDHFDKADATEVMHGFHSGEAMAMLSRLPAARPENIPSAEVCSTPTATTYAFRELRTKLEEEGWFKRNAVGEAGHLLGW